MRKLKIYIASLYSRREEMEEYANILKDNGFYITSRWVYGGEEGKTLEDIAVMDLDDVESADLVLSFTLPHGTLYKGGGRCVEFGYGLALGKDSIIIGERENVFHWHPDVNQYDTLEDFIKDYS